MSELRMLRTLAAPSAMGAATGLRAGLAWLEVWTQSAPQLTRLSMEFWDPDEDPDRIHKKYRRAFVDCYKDSIEAALDEIDVGTSHVRTYLSKADAGPRRARSARQARHRRRERG